MELAGGFRGVGGGRGGVGGVAEGEGGGRGCVRRAVERGAAGGGGVGEQRGTGRPAEPVGAEMREVAQISRHIRRVERGLRKDRTERLFGENMLRLVRIKIGDQRAHRIGRKNFGLRMGFKRRAVTRLGAGVIRRARRQFAQQADTRRPVRW